MMTNCYATTNENWTARFRAAFKPRDIFLHDGTSLRRFTIGANVQMMAALAAFVLLAWSAFATFEAIAAMNGDVAQMQRQVAAMEAEVATMRQQTLSHAATLERRQAFLQQMLSGQATAAQLSALMPPQDATAHGPADAAYAGVEGAQVALAAQAQGVAVARYQETASQLRRLGLNPSELVGGVGGPYEPVTPAAAAASTMGGQNADPRFRELFANWQRMEALNQAVIAIPSARPIQTSISFTSGYGVRSDPFRGRAAMHGGIDLAGPIGTPIYATADGIVNRAEWNNGGYGNLVEINHGQGIQTRYGHMSRLIAQAGQRVHRGDLIGLMGSTGRSTGSHLHYEVRIDGRAVNPIPFMQSGETLVALQRRVGGAIPAVSVGGPGGSR